MHRRISSRKTSSKLLLAEINKDCPPKKLASLGDSPYLCVSERPQWVPFSRDRASDSMNHLYLAPIPHVIFRDCSAFGKVTAVSTANPARFSRFRPVTRDLNGASTVITLPATEQRRITADSPSIPPKDLNRYCPLGTEHPSR